MYVMNCTRPDVACVVSKLSRFTVSPNENHWKAMKRLLGYKIMLCITQNIWQYLKDIVMQIG